MKKEYKVLDYGPADDRLTADRHTNTHFPITRFHSREEVDRRREELRFNLRMAAGLYPWPEKNPLNAKYEDVAEYDDYSVKKVMFESRPGFWSTGNLYLPKPLKPKQPAILSVIGHWDPQRLTMQKEANYPRQLSTFARMGFITLVTDMIGKVDSLQITHEYGTKEEELWLSNGLGVQLWNNIRALDLLCSMPEVDAAHLGVTGSSGGGSQSLFLALADDRITACAPINMISLHFQGGCRCENAPGLRIGTNNGEMCAMIAPRALFLAGSTGDWTKNQMTEEFPAVLEAFRQYGAEDKAEQYYQVAGHQYNEKTRARVYDFFALNLMGRSLKWTEQPALIEKMDMQDLTWFRGKGHAPGVGNDAEFLEAFSAERTRAVAALPDAEKRRMLAWMTGINGEEPATADPLIGKLDGMTLEKNSINGSCGQQIPYIRLTPADWDGKRVCLTLSGRGKECVDSPAVRAMLADGIAVVSGDLFLTGEFEGKEQTILGGERGESYFTTFHYTNHAFQAQDAALLWKAAKRYGTECSLWAEGCAARAAACALPLLEGVSAACLESKALDIHGNEEYYKEFYVPGILELGGLEGCLKLADCPVTRF